MPYFAMCSLHGPNTRPEELQDTSAGPRSEIPFFLPFDYPKHTDVSSASPLLAKRPFR